MHEKTLKQEQRSSRLNSQTLLLIIAFVATFAVFMNKGLSYVLGPVITVLLVYLYFSDYAEVVTALIIVANDAMGTMAFGVLSFPYLLLLLTVIRLFSKRGFTSHEIFFFVVALVLQAELWIVGFTGLKYFVYSMAFILSVIALPRTPESFVKFSRGVLATVCIIALHACLTGGVEFVETETIGPITDIPVIRRGILGVGIGDPNFSSYVLNIGIICAWCDPDLRGIFKLLLTALMLYALAITASISGLIAFVLIGAVVLLSGKHKLRGFLIITAGIVFAVLFYRFYTTTEAFSISIIDSYVLRIDEKLAALELGDMAALTTNRSDILALHLSYLVTQPVTGLLFGGNSLTPIGTFFSHNTYVSLALQVGFVGVIILIVWMLYKLYRTLAKSRDDRSRKYLILLKVLSLFMAINLSLYQGSTWSLWLIFLILL